MRLAEVDGKALLRRHGLAAPRGILLDPGDDPAEEQIRHWPGYFLKAQLLEGGRGKRGLVRGFDQWADFRNARRLILATLDDADTPLLLEESVPVAREIFIALRVDGSEQRLELLIAPEGGEDIEQTAKLARIPAIDGATTAERIYPAIAKLFPPKIATRLARYS